jgi:hypothetical protein
MVEGYSCETRKTWGLSCKSTRAARVDRYRPGRIGSGPSDLDPTARPARTRVSGGGRADAAPSPPAQDLSRPALHDSARGLH